MAWLFLTGAIACEIVGTLSLRMVATGKRVWFTGLASGYLAAFALLSLTLDAGMPLGVAYGIWTAVGVALIAVLSRFLFREPLSWTTAAGIGLIAAGVLVLELGGAH